MLFLTAVLGLGAALLWRRALAHANEAQRLDDRARSYAVTAPVAGDQDEDVLTLTEVWSPPSPVRDLRWIAAAGAMLTPGAVFLLQGPSASALLWIVGVLALGGVIVAERLGWRPAAWLAVCGAGLWSFAAFAWLPPRPEEAAPPILLALLALAGLVHARRNLWAGMALLIAMAAMLLVGAYLLGADTLYGLALCVLVIVAALCGAMWRRLERALAAAWIIACTALLILSGQSSGEIWLAPSAIFAGALFLAIEAIVLPMRGRAALLHSVAGAVAAPFAVGVLYGAGQGPSLPFLTGDSPIASALMQSVFLIITAAAQGAIIYSSARRLNGLSELGLSIVAPALSIAACLIGVAIVTLGPLWSAAPLAALAIAAAYVELRASNPMWNVLALLFAFAALTQAARAIILLLLGLNGATALTFIAFGLALPAVLIGVAARLKGARSSWTSAALEAAALVLGFAALIAIVRWIASAGAPGDFFVTFAEAGVLAGLLTTGAIALMLREARGAFFIRRGAAVFAILGALALVFAGMFGRLNPWWGATPAPMFGLPLVNLTTLGVAAPLAAFVGLAWLAHRRVWDRTNLLAQATIGGLSLLWLALEVHRAFHGADLSAGAIGGAESLALSLAALAVAISLFSVRELFTASERAVAILLSAAIFAKIAFIDLHLPADGWRAASFTSLSLALALILAPRGDVTARARAWP